MLPPPLPDYVEPAKTRITTLANGVKIASETSPVCVLFNMIVKFQCSVSVGCRGKKCIESQKAIGYFKPNLKL